ncbi:MAG: hypothetical protein AAFY28_22500, partial [Actinomycetota bacterium]
IAVDNAGNILAVNTGDSGLELFQGTLNADGEVSSFTLIANITSTLGAVSDISSIDINPLTGELFAVGDIAGSRRVFTIDPTTGLVTTLGGVDPDVALLREIAFADDPAFPGSNILYGVHQNGAVASLARVSIVNGTLDALITGTPITVQGANVTLSGLDTDASGSLISVNEANGSDQRQIIEIDLTNPALSSTRSALGAVPANNVGLGSDINGIIFSIADNADSDTTLVNDAVVRSSGGLGDARAFNGDLGTNLEFVAVTVTPDATGASVFAINDNDGLRELYRIDTDRTSATGVTFLGQITNAQGGAITEIFDIDSDENGTLYVIGSVGEAPVPDASVGTIAGIAGAANTDFNVAALTVTDTGRVFFVHQAGSDPATSLHQLYEIERTANIRGAVVTAVTLRGNITDNANRPINNIQALETDPITGKVYYVGTRDQDGNGTTDDQRELFELNIVNGVSESVGGLIADFDGDGTFSPITDDVTGIALQNAATIEVDPALRRHIEGKVEHSRIRDSLPAGLIARLGPI